MTEATSPPQTLTGGEETPGPAPNRRPRVWRRLVLTVLAAVTVVASLLVLGLVGLIPFGLLLAFSIGADDDATGRSVIGTRRNLGLAAAMVAAFVWFWWWHLDLPETVLVVIAGALIALPLALQESADSGRGRMVVLTRRSLILSIWALVIFVALYYDYGQSFNVLTAVCVVLPAVLVVSRVWSARRGRVELGLLRHPLRRRLRPYLVQGINIWLCCALLGGVIAAGATHYARIGFAFNAPQFQRHDHRLRRRAGPAVGVGARPAPTRAPGHQRGRGPAVGLPRRPAHPDLHPSRRSGRAPLAAGRRVVRPQRRPQPPAQRTLPEREPRRRLPPARRQRHEPTREDATPR